jgi:hypothetical protein
LVKDLNGFEKAFVKSLAKKFHHQELETATTEAGA